jgi:anti-sigma factor RsiW
MIFRRPIPTERDLVALADGSLPAARRVRVERAVASSPELQAVLAAQRRALAAIDDAAVERAPHALRARLELTREPTRRHGTRTMPGLARLLPAGGLAAALAAVAVVLTIGGGVQAPTVAQAAVLATRTPVAAAPKQHEHTAMLAGVNAAGLPFPYWQDWSGFRAVGVRHDRFDGRPTTTVFYQRGGMRVAYTIVSGRPLASGAATSRTARDGVTVWTLAAHGMRVATWLRRGHTCVLSSGNVPGSVLVRLASWRSGGSIPY